MREGAAVRVLFYPAFAAREHLSDHFYRAHWYLRPFHEALTEVVMPHLLDDACVAAPAYLDASVADWAADAPMVTLRHVEDESALDALAREADIILYWQCDPAAPLPAALKGKQVVRIDPHTGRYAGSHYLKIAERFFPALQQEYQRTSEAVFQRIRTRCSGKLGYVFGTGPGLAHASAHDFSDGVSIACNSMVRNHALMERLKPPLIVVGDPIFHAGPSTYAAAFRAALIEALDRYDADLIVPLRDYHVYRAHLPARFAERIAAVPFVAGETPNLDLAQSLSVTTTSNVLTLFLLPLAATFFEEIRIFGCDGRPLDQNSYFWSHDKASQFNEEMDAIQRAHPAFFAIDYDDYYLTHCNTLETWLAAAEAAGKRVSNHTPSFIPALIARNAPGVGEPERPTPPPPAISIIMPAFNAAPFIEEAVQSVIAQDFRDWELLIVEDSSTDDTFAVAERLAAADARVKLMRNPRKGVSAARNTGIEAARGRYIAFLDADDTLDPGSLAARAAALDADPALQLVHSIVRRTDEHGCDLHRPYGQRAALTFRDMWRNPAHVNTLMGRAETLRRFPFPEDITNGEDWLMLARVLRAGFVSHYVAGGGATWRSQVNSTTFKAMARHESGLVRVIDWVYAPCSEAAPEWAEGLETPAKEDVLRERAFGLLVWNILCGEAEGARDILADAGMREWRMRRSPSLRQNAVEAAAVRLFRRPRQRLHEIDDVSRQRIAVTMRTIGLAAEDAPLAAVIAATFRLDESAQRSAPEILRLSAIDLHRHRAVLKVARAYASAPVDVLVCGDTLAGWELSGCSERAGEAWFPAGGPCDLRPASRLIENCAESVHGARLTIEAAREGPVELSGFALGAGRDSIGLWLGEDGAGATFDLTRAQVAHVNASANFPIMEVEMHRSVGEWGAWRQFRIVVWAPRAGRLPVQVNLRDKPRGSTRYRGDGASGVDLWGLHVVALAPPAVAWG